MGWFTRLCRNMGLMVHNAQHPDADERQKRVVKKQTEERKEDGGVIVRRTTIEEIEFPPDKPPKGGE